MAVQAASLYAKIVADTGDLKRGLQEAVNSLNQTKREVEKTSGSVDRLTGAFSGMAKGVMALVGIHGLLGVTRSLMSFAGSAVTTAARVQEMSGVLTLLGERAGYTGRQMEDLTAAVKEKGIETGVAQNMLAQMVRYELDLAKSTQLARVAQDAAVISMQNSSEALQGLIHGITTFNPRVLRTYGIIVSLKDAFEKKAEALGKAADELTTTEKVAAAFNAVLSEGQRVAGAYEQAMEAPGKRLRSLARHVTDLKEALGVVFLDAFGAAVDHITEFVTGLTAAISEGGKMRDALVAIGDAASRMADTLLPAALRAIENILELAAAMTRLPETVKIAVTAFVAMATAMKLLAAVKLATLVIGWASAMGSWIGFLSAAVIELGLVQGATTGLAAAQQALNMVLRANPYIFVAAALAGLAVALHKVHEANLALDRDIQQQVQTVEQQKRALLESSTSLNDYITRVQALGDAYRETHTTYQYMATGMDVVAGSVAQLTREYMVHVGTLNIANEAIDRVAEAQDVAAAATRKFGEDLAESGGRGIKNWYIELQKAKVQLDEYARKTGEAFRSIYTEVTSAFSTIANVVTSHHARMAQMASNYRLEEMRATVEYNATRAQLVARGLDDEVAELDKSFKKAQILRKLDHDIAVIQARAKHAAELAEAKKAFADKLVWWMVEKGQEMGLNEAHQQALINALGVALGEELALRAQNMFDTLNLIKDKNASIVNLEGKLADTLKDLFADTQQSAADAAAAYALEWEKIKNLMEGAWGEIAALGGEGVQNLGKQIKKSAYEVTEDIASTLDSLFSAIASIMETLSQDLPSLPELTIGKWLDQLYKLADEAAQWLVSGAGQTLEKFIEEWGQVYGPQFEKWADQIDVLVTIFRQVSDLNDELARELQDVNTSVSDMFDRLQAVLDAVLAWAESDAFGPFDLALQQLKKGTGWFELLADTLSPLSNALSAMRGVLSPLTSELKAVEASVVDMFGSVQGVMDAILAWASSEAYGQFDLTLQIFYKGREWFEKLADALKPLQTAASAVKGVLDIAAQEIGDIELVVSDFFSNVLRVMQRTREFVETPFWRTAIEILIGVFDPSVEGSVGWILDKLAKSLAPLQAIMSVAKGLLDVASNETQNVAMSVDDFFANLLRMMQRVREFVETPFWRRAIEDLVAVFDPEGEIGQLLGKLAEALQPLGSIIREGVDALTALLEYEGGLSLAVLDQFEADLEMLLRRMATLMERFESEGIELAKEFFENVGAVVRAVGDALGALSALKLYAGPISDATLEDFRNDLEELLRKMKEIQDEFVEEGILLNKEFAEGVQAIVQGAAAALGLLGQLAVTTFHVSTSRINEFARRMKELIIALNEAFQQAIAAGLDPEQFKQVGESLQAAFGVLGDAFAVITGLPSVSLPDVSRIGAFIARVQALVEQFAAIEISDATITAINRLTAPIEAVAATIRSFQAILSQLGREALPREGAVLGLARQITTMVNRLFAGPEGLAAQMAAHPEWEQAAYWAASVGSAISTLVKGLQDMSVTAAEGIGGLQGLGAILAAIDAFMATISGYSLYGFGQSFVQSLIDGIKSKIGELVAVLNELAGYFPASPARRGPLSKMPYGKDIGAGAVGGITEGVLAAIPQLEKALQKIADMIPQSPAKTGPLSDIDVEYDGPAPPIPPIDVEYGVTPKPPYMQEQPTPVFAPQITIMAPQVRGVEDIDRLEAMIMRVMRRMRPEFVRWVSEDTVAATKRRQRYSQIEA